MSESRGLLAVQLPAVVDRETYQKLTEKIAPLALALNLEPLVLAPDQAVTMQVDYSAVLERIAVALESIGLDIRSRG